MISKTTRLTIANICYANVASQFAMFSNPKFRGPNFTWKEFPAMCEEQADLWMILNNVRGNKEEINSVSRQFAKDIATTLVWHLEK